MNNFANPHLIKPTVALVGASLMTASLFVAMQRLISSDIQRNAPEVIDIDWSFAQVPPDTQINERKLLPPPPQATLEPPRRAPETVTTDPNINGTMLTMAGPSISTPALPTFTGPQDNQASPIVQINPSYPPEAARNGTEGWVELRFDISPSGEVINAEITAAEPKRIFDRAALKALQKWKYRPQIVQGQPTTQYNQRIRLDFNLNQ